MVARILLDFCLHKSLVAKYCSFWKFYGHLTWLTHFVKLGCSDCLHLQLRETLLYLHTCHLSTHFVIPKPSSDTHLHSVGNCDFLHHSRVGHVRMLHSHPLAYCLFRPLIWTLVICLHDERQLHKPWWSTPSCICPITTYIRVFVKLNLQDEIGDGTYNLEMYLTLLLWRRKGLRWVRLEIFPL